MISRGTAGTGPAWFEVRTKTGQRMEFGNSTDSRVLAQGKTTARSWALSKVADTTGNYFTVSYTNDSTNGQVYPSRIDYTGNTAAGLSPYNSVQFTYATRSDLTPMYHAGSVVKTTQRMTAIKTYTGTTLVAQYNLSYRQSPALQVSLLNSVTLCAGDGSCLPATTFTWADGDTAQWSTSVDWATATNVSGYTTGLGDVNGDGKTDLIVHRANSSGWSATVALSNGDGTFGSPVSFQQNGSFGGYATALADVNGDSKTDLIAYYAGSSTYSTFVALSNGDGTFAPMVALQESAELSAYATTFVDVNGDGRADAVAYYVGPYGWRVKVALSNGDGTFALQPTWLRLGDFSGYVPAFADVNGDGKTDAIVSSMGSSNRGVMVALANGDGTFAPSVSWQRDGYFGGYTAAFADVNGDGKADAIASYMGSTNWGVLVALAKGDGTFTTTVSWQEIGAFSGYATDSPTSTATARPTLSLT